MTSYQNAPNLANLKNDFAIWGARTGADGSPTAVHLRYAIDTKPVYYTKYDGSVTYTTKTKEEVDFDIEMGAIDVSRGFQKTPNPIFAEGKQPLPEDWWEAQEWADYYKECTGEYPQGMIQIYAEKTTGLNLSDYFAQKCDSAGNVLGTMPNTVTSGFDTIFTVNGMWYQCHYGCVHNYEQHLMDWKEQGQLIFVHKPELPEDILNQEGVEVIPIGSSVKYEMDWRELIYQMALDYKEHGDKDDFLTTISFYNKAHYPTGYTGYEHYYNDMEGFWRQLYDPDYTTSYDVIYLSKVRYMEESKYEEFFYDAPIYTQCKVDDAFFHGVLYYKKVAGEYEPCDGLLQTEYGKNPSQYYLITDTEIKPIPLVTESFKASNSYWERKNGGYVAATNVTSNKYAEKAINLYLRTSDYSYFPCMTIKPFVPGKLYFVTTTDGDYKVDATVKEDIYLSEPGKFYERVISGGQIKFANCTIIQPFDENREYFSKDEKGAYSRVRLTKEEYEALGTENEYYYAVIHYSYIPCIHPKYEYDHNCNYYMEGLKEYELDPDSPSLYWNKKVQESPELLNFWIDFLDTYGELSQYSVSSVGDRPKAVNDSNVKAIYFRETPGVIFVEDLNSLEEKKSGYTYAQLPQHMEYMFSISGQGKSAKDVLDGFLYTHSYCVESITISAIPIYHLEPNTRIFVRDDSCGISGEYIVTRINYPLAANGTMSINATKVVDRIY